MDGLSIEESFSKSLEQRGALDKLRQSGSGEPMFTPKQMFESHHLLDQMIRGIIIKKGITKDMFSELQYRYEVEDMGRDSKQAVVNKGNLFRALKKGGISVLIFQRTLRILRLGVLDMEVITTSVDDDDGIQSFKLSDLRTEFVDQTNVASTSSH